MESIDDYDPISIFDSYLRDAITISLFKSYNPMVELPDELKLRKNRIDDPNFRKLVTYLFKKRNISIYGVGVDGEDHIVSIKSDMWKDILERIIQEDGLEGIVLNSNEQQFEEKYVTNILFEFDNLDEAIYLLRRYTDIMEDSERLV